MMRQGDGSSSPAHLWKRTRKGARRETPREKETQEVRVLEINTENAWGAGVSVAITTLRNVSGN